MSTIYSKNDFKEFVYNNFNMKLRNNVLKDK